jgi:mRNA interferase RelE/StbE
MSYTIIIETRAQRDFKALPSAFATAIKSKIDGLEREPRPHGVKKLAGSKDGYRIRVGDYRVLYTIDDRGKIVTIYRIRHRREVYL